MHLVRPVLVGQDRERALSLVSPDVLATVAELERQRLGERIALAPLEPEAVEELVRALRGGSDEVPPTIQEAILRRVARLPTDAQALLSIAAVFGERFELEPVRRIAELDEAAALAA